MTTIVERIADGDGYALLDLLYPYELTEESARLELSEKQFFGADSESSLRAKHVRACIDGGFINGDVCPSVSDGRVPTSNELVQLAEEIEESHPNVTVNFGVAQRILNYDEVNSWNGTEPEMTLEPGTLEVRPVPLSDEQLPAGISETMSYVFGMTARDNAFSIREYESNKIKISWRTNMESL